MQTLFMYDQGTTYNIRIELYLVGYHGGQIVGSQNFAVAGYDPGTEPQNQHS
jgi:hypothetical protein